MILPEIVNNPFRTLGVCVNSTAKDIAACKSKFSAFMRVNRPVKHDLDLNSVLPPVERSEKILEETFVAMAVPRNKLRHGMFWFMENDFFKKDVLPLLTKGDLAGAINALKKAEKDIVNMQNLMIVYLIFGMYSDALDAAYFLFSQKKDAYQGMMTDLFSLSKTYFIERLFEAFVKAGISSDITFNKPTLKKWEPWYRQKQEQEHRFVDSLLDVPLNFYSSTLEILDLLLNRTVEGFEDNRRGDEKLCGLLPPSDISDDIYNSTSREISNLLLGLKFDYQDGKGNQGKLLRRLTAKIWNDLDSLLHTAWTMGRAFFLFPACTRLISAAEAVLGGKFEYPFNLQTQLKPLVERKNFIRLFTLFLQLIISTSDKKSIQTGCTSEILKVMKIVVAILDFVGEKPVLKTASDVSEFQKLSAEIYYTDDLFREKSDSTYAIIKHQMNYDGNSQKLASNKSVADAQRIFKLRNQEFSKELKSLNNEIERCYSKRFKDRFNPELLEFYVQRKAYLDMFRRKDFSYEMNDIIDRLKLLSDHENKIQYLAECDDFSNIFKDYIHSRHESISKSGDDPFLLKTLLKYLKYLPHDDDSDDDFDDFDDDFDFDPEELNKTEWNHSGSSGPKKKRRKKAQNGRNNSNKKKKKKK